MVRGLANGVRIIELGRGTTFVSTVTQGDEAAASAICFSNRPLTKLPGKAMDGSEVLIEITSFDGAVSYIRGLVELLKTWDVPEIAEPLKGLDQAIALIQRQ